MKRALVALAACSGAAPAHPSARGTPPVRYARVDVADVTYGQRIRDASGIYIIQNPSLADLEPARDAVLASDRKAQAALRKLVDDRAAAKAALQQAVRDKKRDQVAALDAKQTQLTDALVDALAQVATLTLDGQWLLVIASAERAEDHYESALSAYLDTNPDGDQIPMPDYGDVLATVEAFAAKHPDHPGARYLATSLELDSARDEAGRSKAARRMLELAQKSPGTVVEQPAYRRAASALLSTSTRDDQRAAIVALRWLADHDPDPEHRADALYRGGVTLQLLRDPAATELLCRLAGDTTLGQSFQEDTTVRLASALVGDPDALHAACAATACPCIQPVLAELATFYAGDNDIELARDVMAHLPPPQLHLDYVATDATRARDQVTTSAARRCLEREPDTHGDAIVEIAIGDRGTVTDVHLERSTLGDRVATCMLVALRRQTWLNLDRHLLVVPLHVAPG